MDNIYNFLFHFVAKLKNRFIDNSPDIFLYICKLEAKPHKYETRSRVCLHSDQSKF